jgi:hypothetical protein
MNKKTGASRSVAVGSVGWVPPLRGQTGLGNPEKLKDLLLENAGKSSNYVWGYHGDINQRWAADLSNKNQTSKKAGFFSKPCLTGKSDWHGQVQRTFRRTFTDANSL